MRFHVGIVPPNPEFHPEQDNWQRFREPSSENFIRLAIAFGVVIAGPK